jgi:hypothetical protein
MFPTDEAGSEAQNGRNRIRKVDSSAKEKLRRRPDFGLALIRLPRPGAGILDGPRWEPLEPLPVTLGAPSSTAAL